MNKYDSEFSALKALAYSVGVTTPQGGWDSSYSIIASMYEHLVGAPVEAGVMPIDMLGEIQRGAESGEIVISDNCINEIERLNSVINSLEEQLENCGSGGSSGSDISDFFTQIGYTYENNGKLFDNFHADIEYSLKKLNEWNPDMDYMYVMEFFKDTCGLVYAPMIDVSKYEILNNMFGECSNLISVPKLDTSNATSMDYMFEKCSSLRYLPQFDTSNVTSMYSFCRYCSSLKEVPLLNTSKVQNMSYMFGQCLSLETIPQLDTSAVTDVSRMFTECNNLKSLPLLDFSNVTNISYLFGSGSLGKLEDLGGFAGLKINWASYALNQCTQLTVQSLLNVFNTIADVNDLGGRSLKLGSVNLSKLTDDQKAIAINKGWTLS